MLKYPCAATAEQSFINGAAAINEALHRQAIYRRPPTTRDWIA